MKKWILNVFKRIGDLIIKLIGVKALFAFGMTALAVFMRGDHGTVWWAAVAWCLLIGAREVQKIVTLVKGLQLPGGGS